MIDDQDIDKLVLKLSDNNISISEQAYEFLESLYRIVRKCGRIKLSENQQNFWDTLWIQVRTEDKERIKKIDDAMGNLRSLVSKRKKK